MTRIDVALTHFHLDHVCGLAYLPALPVMPTVHAPGAWLYGTPSAQLLAPLLSAPLSPFDHRPELCELRAGEQTVGPFTVTARAQPRHWHPTAGLRVEDRLALITDTGYDPGSAQLARGVEHLLHEAWTPGDACDASEEDAAQVAGEAGAGGSRSCTCTRTTRAATTASSSEACPRCAASDVLGRDVTVVAELVEQREQRREVERTAARLAAPGVVGDLHVRDQLDVLAQRGLEVLAHPRHVEDVVLQRDVGRADGAHERGGVGGARQQVGTVVERVDGLDQHAPRGDGPRGAGARWPPPRELLIPRHAGQRRARPARSAARTRPLAPVRARPARWHGSAPRAPGR